MNDYEVFLIADNYRGFSESYIPLKQVNYLVGENSTGKSSIIDLIELFQDLGFWLIEPNFGSSRTPSLESRHFTDLITASSIAGKEFTIGALEFDNAEAANNYGMLVTYQDNDGRPTPVRVTVLDGNIARGFEGIFNSTKSKNKKVKLREISLETASAQDLAKGFYQAHRNNQKFSNVSIPEEISLQTPFFALANMIEASGPDKKKTQVKLRIPHFFQKKIFSLAPIRTKPKRTYDEPQTKYSVEGHHTPYAIDEKLSDKTNAAAFKKFLDSAGADSHLFNALKIKKFGRGQRAPFELNVVLKEVGLTLDNVGYGVSQALPILVEMFIRKPSSLFLIQQPEVHLHPRAQATIGDLVADLARSDKKRFVIETHSDFLIDRFRLNVRNNGPISSQLLFFERTDVGNIVTPISVTDDGGLSESQPESYREFFFNESMSLLS